MASCQAVCWEWQRDDGGFCPYIPEDSSKLELALARGTSQCQIDTYVVDFRKLVQCRKAGGGKRMVQRVNLQLPTTPDITAYWTWAEYPGKFVPYHTDTTVDIELAHLQHVTQVDLSQKPSRLPYTIDFQLMNQTRHSYNTQRAIRRVPLLHGVTLQALLSPQPASLNPPVLASGVAAGPSHLRSGFMSGGTLPGPTSGSIGVVLGASPLYTASGSGTMLGATPLPHSYGSGLSSTTPLTGLGTPGGAVAGSSGHPIGTSHSGTTPHLGYLNHTHFAPSGPHIISTANISSHVSSASMVSNSSTPPPLLLCSSTSTTSAAAPSMVTRSKSGSRKTSKAASTATPPSVPKKSVKGKSRAKPRKTAHTAVGGASNHDDSALSAYARKVNKLKAKHDEPCPICMSKLSEQSGFEDDDALPTAPGILNIYRLRKCGHKLHYPCLTMYMKNCAKSGFQCPTCKRPYGVKTGDMPDGKMTVHSQSGSLPGHSGCGTIQITYNFSSGYHNGTHYRTNGFPRTCYLPNSAKGQKVLKLLKVAWERRLTFTIGTSVTTGAVDTVVWNEIHHKTESHSNHSGHGFPDLHYLDRVILELVAQGVTGEAEEEAEDVESSESSDDDGAQVNLSGSDDSL